MSSLPELKLDWCSYESAKYAVEKWHYSKRMPSFKRVKIGVWEGGAFIGVIIFSNGATPEIGKPFGLKQTEVCELTRIALKNHRHPVSKMLSIAVGMLKKKCPGIRLVISFADVRQGHRGVVYQASGWLYLGLRRSDYITVNGVEVHRKTLHSRFGIGGQSISWLRTNVDENANRVSSLDKHKYVMPLDSDLRTRIKEVSLKYPKHATSVESDASANHAEEGGAIPTVAFSK